MKSFILVFVLLIGIVTAWDNDEFEIFDLVEEIQGKTFYEFMDIGHDATTNEVRKAYKKLALIWHPDKNDAPDASEKFRQLAAVYEVLKDKAKREIYDRVLVEGLPDWKMPVFYFRRMRKMGLAEGLAYLVVIVTVCQYFINWAAYLEKKFTISENVSAAVKKKQKKLRKQGKNEDDVAQEIIDEEVNLLGPKPTCFDTLPFQLYRASKFCLLAIPGIPGFLYNLYKESQRLKEEKIRQEEEEEEERKRRDEEKEKRKEAKAKRKNVNRYREATDDDDCLLVSPGREGTEEADSSKAQPRNALQMWTDEDLATLAKFIKKYPGGTADRWDTIAEAMERLPWEVTKMAAKIKNNPNIVPITSAGQGLTGLEQSKHVSDEVLEDDVARDSQAETETGDSEDSTDDDYVMYTVAGKEDYVPVEEKKKKKTKAEVVETEEEDAWSQEQQKALESALSQFPKGSAERWDRIAGKVSGKNKEQCMLRFKHLAEIIKKKKEASQ